MTPPDGVGDVFGVATRDRWLYGWSVGYGAVGAASLLVPLYAIELGAGPFLVGLLAATAAFAGVPGAVLWGRLAARTGRRRVLVVVSLALTAASLLAVALVSSLALVLAANAALWFAASAAAPVLALLVVDATPENQWDARIGLLNSVQGYGWLGGLLAGAAWTAGAGAVGLGAVDGQRAFFVVAAVATLGGLALTARSLPDPPTVTEARFERSTRALARLVRGGGARSLFVPFGASRSYWALRRLHPRRLAARLTTPLGTYLLAVLCSFTGFAVFFGPLPSFLTGLGYATDQVFGVFLASSAASAVFYSRAGDMATARGPERLQLGVLSARSVLFPAVALVGATGGFAVLVALFVVVGLTWAVVAVTATSIVTRLAPPAVRGEALGAYTALGSVGTGVGSLLGGALAAGSTYGVTFGVAGAFVLAGAALAFVGYRQRTGLH